MYKQLISLTHLPLFLIPYFATTKNKRNCSKKNKMQIYVNAVNDTLNTDTDTQTHMGTQERRFKTQRTREE